LQIKTPEYRLEAQIFYEKRRMQQNTVNDCFPAFGTGGRAVFDYWRIRWAGAALERRALRLA
jgi:hypothetical protein